MGDLTIAQLRVRIQKQGWSREIRYTRVSVLVQLCRFARISQFRSTKGVYLIGNANCSKCASGEIVELVVGFLLKGSYQF